MSITSTHNRRPLHIRFDNYGADDDPDFKYELMVLMSGSLRELKSAAAVSVSSGDSDHFKKAAHKAKSTLTLIDDPEVTRMVEEFGTGVGIANTTEKDRMLNSFNALLESILNSLACEAGLLKH